ncbi:nucleoid occlusion protein [Evansella cellulosilytica]|uniref:ParB-like partition protein n=1 Tax=Evansella cellulosilytica (strain ATCC 21833 / DSM 2522 / FERM P-1141 / JCM 9156 / N-4) TaxID=649639 RepID=E6TZY4_EVAC2|nr:nucleoid occlusion protein [Evansella cellulosilytica]ADU32550.1 parB-like partition protein [Evansella cellulosilytica DSM 2522]
MKQPFTRLFGLSDKNEETEEITISEKEEVHQLPIDKIVPNQFQPRTVFQDERIEELAQTIKTHGIIQPIVVRVREDDIFELIAGERRWRAVQKLGWETIPAIIKEFNDSQTASVALIENLQREGLTSIEEATAYAKLLEIHNLTQESLAQRLGKGQSTIANKLRLLQLPQIVQDALLNRQITERHARALIALKNVELQEKLLERIINEELNVKQTEEAAKKILEGNNNTAKKPKPLRKSVSRDMRLAMNTIRKSVDMVVQTGMNVDTSEEEHDEYYQFTIRIPK